MKTLSVLLALCFTACSFQKEAPVARPLAPTVLKPAPSKPVDLTPVNTGIKPVAEANRQLQEQLAGGKRSIYELNRRIAMLDASRQATLEDWKRMTTLGEETRAALDESEKIQADQRTAIDSLEKAVSTAQQDVIASDYEKRQLIAGLDKANFNIEALTKEQQSAAGAAQRAQVDVEVVKGQKAAEVKWKWRFFWWGTTATVLLAGIAYLKIAKPF